MRVQLMVAAFALWAVDPGASKRMTYTDKDTCPMGSSEQLLSNDKTYCVCHENYYCRNFKGGNDDGCTSYGKDHWFERTPSPCCECVANPLDQQKTAIPLFRTCYQGGTVGHGWMVFKGSCDDPEHKGRSHLETIMAGCGFGSTYDPKEHGPWSTWPGIGWGGGQNDGIAGNGTNDTTHKTSAGDGRVVATLSSLVPGLRTGSLHYEGHQCGMSTPWPTASEVCMRAVINELAPKYDRHRQWTWSAAAAWVGTGGHGFREEDCATASKHALGRDEVLAGSAGFGGFRLYVRNKVCWDFIDDTKYLYCDAKKEDSKAFYAPLCKITNVDWSNKTPGEQLLVMCEVYNKSRKYWKSGSKKRFFQEWAEKTLKQECAEAARGYG